MIRQIVFIAVSLLTATIAASKAVALESSSRRTGDLVKQMDDRTIQCIIEHNPDLVLSWFNTLPGSSLERKLVSRREGQLAWCNGTVLAQAVDWVPQYDFGAIRVAILHFLLKNGSVVLPESRPAGLDKAAWYATEGSLPPESVVANDLGFCLAKSDWPAARTVVLSQRGSTEEATALRKLVPLIGGCIPAGAKLEIDKARLREILEETAYHAVGGTAAAGGMTSIPRSTKQR
jgi:hypothetical protein